MMAMMATVTPASLKDLDRHSLACPAPVCLRGPFRSARITPDAPDQRLGRALLVVIGLARLEFVTPLVRASNPPVISFVLADTDAIYSADRV